MSRRQATKPDFNDGFEPTLLLLTLIWLAAIIAGLCRRNGEIAIERRVQSKIYN